MIARALGASGGGRLTSVEDAPEFGRDTWALAQGRRGGRRAPGPLEGAGDADARRPVQWLRGRGSRPVGAGALRPRAYRWSVRPPRTGLDDVCRDPSSESGRPRPRRRHGKARRTKSRRALASPLAGLVGGAGPARDGTRRDDPEIRRPRGALGSRCGPSRARCTNERGRWPAGAGPTRGRTRTSRHPRLSREGGPILHLATAVAFVGSMALLWGLAARRGHRARARVFPSDLPPGGPLPLVSILVPAWNEDTVLANCVERRWAAGVFELGMRNRGRRHRSDVRTGPGPRGRRPTPDRHSADAERQERGAQPGARRRAGRPRRLAGRRLRGRDVLAERTRRWHSPRRGRLLGDYLRSP